jgi:hypothetical protein
MDVKEFNEKYKKSAIEKDYLLLLRCLVDKWKTEMFPDLKEWNFFMRNCYNDEGSYYNCGDYFGEFVLGDWVIKFENTFEDYRCGSCEVCNDDICFENISTASKNNLKKNKTIKSQIEELEKQISKLSESIELCNSLNVGKQEFTDKLTEFSLKKESLVKKLAENIAIEERTFSEKELAYINDVIISDISNLDSINLPFSMLVDGCNERDIDLTITPSKST